ncbi:MAG: acyltransferase [Terricaulis sp.]
MVAGQKSAEVVNALDVGRGLAIVAVMYGHALSPWFMLSGDSFSEAAFLQWKFGAAYMMAFFFFLSGIGWRSNRSLAAACQQGLSLLVIAWLANVGFDVLRVALTLTGVTNALGVEGLSVGEFVRHALRLALLSDKYSLGAMWFLAVLGLIRIIAAFAVRGGKQATVLVTLALIALSIVANQYYWRNVFQILLLGVAFPFFIAGYALREVWERAERRPLTCAVIGVVSGVLTFATYGLNQGCRWNPLHACGSGWLNGHFGVSMINGEYGNWMLFTLTAVAGTVFASCMALLLARFGARAGAALAHWGKVSMDLLIVNSFFVVLIGPPMTIWLAPKLPAQGLLFFLALLAATLIFNLSVRALLARPLKRLRLFSKHVAIAIVSSVTRSIEALAVMQRDYRVSRGND